MIKNTKVGVKIGLLTFPVVIVLILVTVALLNNVNWVNTSLLELSDLTYQLNSTIISADRDFYQADQASLKFRMTNLKNVPADGEAPELPPDEEEHQKGHLEDFDKNAKQVEEGIAEIENIAKGNEKLYTGTKTSEGKTLKELIDTFNQNFTTWKGAYTLSTGEGSEESQMTAFDTARDSIDLMEEVVDTYKTEQTEQLEATIHTVTTVTIIVVVLVILCLSVLIFTMSQYMTKALKKLKDIILKVGENDLTVEPAHIDTKDEFGDIGRATDGLVEELKEVIVQLKDSSDSLLNASERMNKVTGSTTMSVDSISTAINDLAHAATQQADDTEKISSSVMDMQNVVQESVGCADHLTTANQQIETATSEGTLAVDELLETTKQSNEALDAIFEIIDSIGKSTNKISESSDLISQIATQTNLLSLNASIEAARAGEAGKGFAVVADEIRQLSEQSAETVHVINTMLAELQGNAENAVKQSNIVKGISERQSENVHNTNDKFELIVRNVHAVNEQIRYMEQINENLSQNSGEVADLASGLAAIAQENAAVAQEVSATAETVANSMNEVSEVSDGVQEHSRALEEIIGMFRVS